MKFVNFATLSQQKNQQTIEFKVKKDMKELTRVHCSKGVLGLLSGLKSRINTCLPLLTMLIMLMVGAGNAWGATLKGETAVGSGKGTAKVEVCYYSGAVVDDNSTTGSSLVEAKTSAVTGVSWFYCTFTATPNNGYYFDAWYTNSGCSQGKQTANSYSTSYYKSTFGTREDIYYACFLPVTVSSAESASTSFNHPKTKTVTLSFPVSDKADANADFNAPTIEANTGWSISSWNLNTSTHKVEVVCSYTASSDISKGAHSAKVTLTSKANNSNTGTVTANVDLTPTLTFDNGSVDVSVSDADKTTLDVATLLTAYKGADNVAGDGAITYALKTANSNVSLTSAGIFYAKALGTYTIVATAAKGRYYAKTAEFNVTVNKRTPTLQWNKTGENDHIYSGDTLVNLAYASYGNSTFNLPFEYSVSPAGVLIPTAKKDSLIANPELTQEAACNVTASFAGNETYCAINDTHPYNIEAKITPLFKLGEEDLPESPVKELKLKVGETANMTFVGTDESNNRFTYPTNPSYVSYEHNSAEHTGVITAVKAGDEEIQFHQTGTTTIFDHLRKIHVYVSKHEVNLATTLDGGTWKVDSIYDGAVYSIVTPTGSQPALSDVSVTSSNEAVLKKVDGHWKAVGEGVATLTISHPSTNDYWVDQTITATITVEKHTPKFTWHLPETVNYNRSFAEPVSSDNTDEGCTFTYVSGNTAAINYVNGVLRTFEKSASNVAITVTQAGNYKWAERSQTFYVNVEKLADHVPFTVNNSSIYGAVVEGGSGTRSFSTGGGIQLGGDETSITKEPAWNWDDKYVIIKFEGVPGTLDFEYKTNNSSASNAANKLGEADWYIQESADGTFPANGEKLWTSTRNTATSYEKVGPRELKPYTRYIKLCYSGNFAGRFKDVHITERTEITGATTVDFGATDAGSNASVENPKISWYNVNPLTLTIEGENASQFAVSPAEIASAKDAYAENVPLTISYIHNRAAIKDTATLVITDGTITKRIGLRGTTNKVTPAITWKENLSPMQRGVNEENPATSPVTLVYTSTDPTVVEIEGSTLKPLKKGTATITASFDGSADPVYNSASSTQEVVVTDVKVQHISWTQNFKRLKWTDDEELSAKNTPDFPLVATVSYYDADKKEEIIIDRPIMFTSNDNSVVQVLNGTTLHVVGTGTTTLEAHVEGISDSLYEATAVRDVIVREPSLDCESWVLKDKGGSINTINVYEFTLEDEADTIYFDAWREAIKVVIDYTSGDLYLDEVYENESTKNIWHNETKKNTHTSYKALLSRKAKKVRFYTTVGATGYHIFDGVYARRARYVEFENGKDTMHLTYTKEDAKPGVAKTKSFNVKFSNITDQLEFEFKGGANSKFSVVSPASIGTQCGDHGEATVTVQFLSNDVETYRDTLLIKNLNQLLTVYLEAEVDKHHQQITWNPVTELKTTDEVTFDATTSAAAAGLSVRYEVVEGDAATVNAETGALTIIKDGNVTIKATAEGNASYYDAEPASKTFSISKVTPTITTVPTAATMTLPNTNLSGCGLAGGVASVDGTFAWADNTIDATLNNAGYTVIFTPENTNWYSTNSCIVVVPVNKTAQAIVWDFDLLEMFCNAQVTFDAHSNSGLAELPVSYSSSDESIAYVDGNNHLNIIQGGEVTITATQGGNAIYAAAEPVSKTLTINRFAPTIVTLPNASTMKIGRSLSDASLTGGLAELDGLEVEGSFAWVDGNTTVMDVAGTFSKQVVFTPANTNYYEPVYDQKSVTVEKYAPEIAQSLHGSDITYGQPLSASNLTGTLTATDIIKIPSVEVEGTFAWLQPSAVLNAGSQSATVRFTPANMDWYEVVDFPVQLNVNKASTEGLTVTGVSEIFYGQILGEAVLENTTVDPIHGGVVAGTMVWNASLNLDEYMEVGSHNLSVTFTVNDPNYIYATLDGTAVLTVQAGYVFNGNDGQSKTWGEDTNWQGNEAPDGNEKVVILADVDIDSPVSVDAITIKEGVTVRVKEGAVLTIGNSDSFVRSSYGNLYVENGGQVIFGEGEVQVHDFTLEAKLGDADNLGMSGQVSNPATLKVRGNAYFDLALDPSGECSPGWYDFTVPFPVDALNGVTRFDNTTHMEKTIKNEKNYAIMDFSESRRLETGYGWKKYRSVMQPGQCYTITIDDVDNVYRFKMVKDGSFNNQTIAPLAYTDVEDNHRGWNGLGNGTLSYINLSAANIEKVQVYSHATRAYTAVPMDTFTYVVGSAYFVQAPSINSVMNYTQGGDTHVLRAPKREAVGVSEFTLTLTKENAASSDDRFYVSASEDATDSYTIGRELTKFGAPTDSKVAQIWTEAYGMKLCDIEMQLVNEEANCALSLFAPNAGSYELKIERAPEDAALYLTYNDNVIWDLTSSPYVFDLSKGTTTGYGLRIEARGPQIATGVDNANAEGQAMRKVIIDNKVYIITPEGKMYDIMGKSVKY